MTQSPPDRTRDHGRRDREFVYSGGEPRNQKVKHFPVLTWSFKESGRLKIVTQLV